MSAARGETRHTVASVGEAEQAIANLAKIMERLAETIAEETEQVRAGRLPQAGEETAKAELARVYAAETARLAAGKDFVARALPSTAAALRRRHEAFQQMLQINLTVLATAHAVSEGIIRGVSGELARSRIPQTYGASGRTNGLGPRAAQPLAVSRKL